MADLPDWPYWKVISITGQAGAGTDYQVELEIGDSAGGDFHLEGHCTNFPQDIRITDDDGTTLLDHWVEDLTADPIVVRVKVDDDLGSNQDIRIYYGKSGETTVSNIANTFIVGDDFEDALQGDWATLAGTIDYDNTDHAFSGSQCMKISESSRTEISVTPSANIIIEYQLWKKNAALHYMFHSDTVWVAHIGITAAENIEYYTTSWQDTGDDITPDEWELMTFGDFDWSAHTYDIERNGVQSYNDAGMWNYGVRGQNAVELQNYPGDDTYIDNFIVRKYNSPEPAFSSAGVEQTPTVGAIMNQFQGVNLGADLYNGVFA